MRMMHKILPPSVQYRDKTDRRAEMVWVGCDRVQCFGGGLKQEVVDHPLVLGGDGRDLLWKREDNVEVRHGQRISLAVLEPLGAGERLTLRTVPITTRVVGDALMPAGVALLDVATQRGRTTLFDRGHNAMLLAAKRVAMHIPIGGPVTTQNVR